MDELKKIEELENVQQSVTLDNKKFKVKEFKTQIERYKEEKKELPTKSVSQVHDEFEAEIAELDEDKKFVKRLRKLDQNLALVTDPELADYMVLVWLRDTTDLQAETKIKEYKIKFA